MSQEKLGLAQWQLYYYVMYLLIVVLKHKTKLVENLTDYKLLTNISPHYNLHRNFNAFSKK